MSEDRTEVLPPIASAALGIAWIALFGYRWIAAPFLLAAGILSPSVVADLDDRVLFRVYLVLLAITVVVIVLRAMRGSSRQSNDRGGSGPEGRSNSPSNAG